MIWMRRMILLFSRTWFNNVTQEQKYKGGRGRSQGVFAVLKFISTQYSPKEINISECSVCTINYNFNPKNPFYNLCKDKRGYKWLQLVTISFQSTLLNLFISYQVQSKNSIFLIPAIQFAELLFVSQHSQISRKKIEK